MKARTTGALRSLVFGAAQAMLLSVALSGCGGCDEPVEVEVLVDPVVADFEAAPSSILAGERSTLSWRVENASSVTIENDRGVIEQVFQGSEAKEGSLEVRPTRTTTYTLKALNVSPSGGQSDEVERSATVEVRTAPVSPTVELTLDPTTIVLGDSATLTWETTGATAVSLQANGVGVDLPEGAASGGSIEVSPEVNTDYRMVATGEDSEVESTVSLAVLVPPTIVAFAASSETVNAGESVELSWQTTAAMRIEIRRGEEVLMTSGKDPLMDTLTISMQETSTFVLRAENTAGSAQAELRVEVRPRPAVLTLIAEPTQIARGQTSTLRYTTRDAESIALFDVTGQEPVEIEIGEVDPDGDGIEVAPQETKTFRLEASGPGGRDQAEVTVAVVEPVVIDLFVVEPELINLGEGVRLRWQTRGATAISIADSRAQAVEVDPELVSGEVQLTPQATTTWTLSASGPGGAAEAQATVTVDDSARVSLTLDPEIIDEGSSSTLSWQTIAVDRIELSAQVQGGPVEAVDVSTLSAQADFLTVSPTRTTTWTLTGFGPNGQQSASVTLQVNPAVRILSVEADRRVVVVGESATVSWETANAAAVSLSFGTVRLEVEPSGTFVAEDLQQNTTFTITAEGVQGPVTQSVTVGVRERVPPTIEAFSAAPSLLNRDDAAQVSWDVTGAESLSLVVEIGGAAPVEIDISAQPLDVGQIAHVPGASATYRLVAVNTEGRAEAETSLTVPLAILSFEADPASVTLGQDVALNFRVQAADAVRLTVDDAPVEVSVGDDGRGSFTVEAVDRSFTASLEVQTGEDTAVEFVEVTLLPPTINAFGVSRESAGIDDEVVLSWSVTGAASLALSAELEGFDGPPIAIDIGLLGLEGGELTLVPSRSTIYRLVATNNAGQDEAEASVAVPLEILELTASDAQVDLGGAALVSFRLQGALSAEVQVDGGEPAPVAFGADGRGTFELLDIDATHAVTIRAFGLGGDSVQEAVTIALRAPQIESFVVEVERGEVGHEARVSWQTVNAASIALVAEIEGLGDFSVDVSGQDPTLGEIFVFLPVTTTFRLVALNSAGQAEASALGPVALDIVFLGASPNPVPFNGFLSVFFQAEGALSASVSINEGEPVALDLDLFGFGGFALEGVDGPLSIVLTVEGPGGQQVSELLNVPVEPPSVVAFFATPEQSLSGEPVQLDWALSGAQRFSIQGVDSRGNVFDVNVAELPSVQGNVQVEVFLTTTFTLTVINPGGQATAQASVTISNEPLPATIDEYFANSEVVLPFGSTSLFWLTSNAVSLRLERLDDQDQVLESFDINPGLIAEGFFDVEQILEPRRYRLVATGQDRGEVTAIVAIGLDAAPVFVGLSEVFYDSVGGDDRLEWIELYNSGPFAVNLSRIGLGYGGGSFASATLALPDFVIQPGECVVVGGPLSQGANHNPEIDAPLHINPNLQNSGDRGGRADGLALFDLDNGAIDAGSVPFDAVVYGGFVQEGDNFLGTFEAFIFSPDVGDTVPGQSIYRVVGGGQEVLNVGDEGGVGPLGVQGGRGGSWAIQAAPTPGRCFGLPPEGFEFGDAQVREGRRRGPEAGGNALTLAAFNAPADITEVFFGTNRAECEDDIFFGGLRCVVPPGQGIVDLLLRQPDGDVLVPAFYTYEPVDFCNTQFPIDVDGAPGIEGGVGEQVLVFGRVFEDGLTQPGGSSNLVSAQLGFGPLGSDPGLVPNLWTWQEASFNVQVGNDDEYMAILTLPAQGSYSYAFRVSLGGSIFTYCDANGTVNNNPGLGNFFSPQDTATMLTF